MKINKKNLVIAIVILLLTAGYFTVTKKNTSTNLSEKPTIVTSFYPLYFIATEIGRDKVEVKNITPAGAEPHDYEPPAQDIARMETSDLIILNGQLEAWGERIKNDLQTKNIPVILAGEGLITEHDPHIWLSPVLMKVEIDRILNGFIAADPKNESYYRANATVLEAKIDALNNEYQTGLAQCKRRDFITSHTAFSYLAKAYNLKQVAISGVSPDEEPSAKQLAEIVEFAKKNNVNYIFFETLISPKLAETIANEIKAKTLVLDPIEGVTQQDMKAGKNYLTIMQDNLTNLKTALECQ